MDHQRQCLNLRDRLDTSDYKNCVALKEPDTSIRSVLHFSEEENIHDYAFRSIMPQFDSPGTRSTDIPDAIRTDSSSTELNGSFSASPLMSKGEKGSAEALVVNGFSSINGDRNRQEGTNLQNSESDWNQVEHVCDDRSPYTTSVQPSPISDIATPPTNSERNGMTNTVSALSLPASAMMQSPTSVSTDGSVLLQQHPQLYSAIGSLEEPTSNSLTRWNQKSSTTTKYEFPSNTLLKPMNTIKQRKTDTDGWIRTSRGKTSAIHAARKAADTSSAVVDAATVSGKKASPPKLPESGNVAMTRKKPSNLKKTKQLDENDHLESKSKTVKHVTISEQVTGSGKRSRNKKKGPLEMFRPSSDAYTPRMGKKEIKYKPAELRTPVQTLATSLGTLQRPNFRDALRRVAMILRQHIVKIEHRFETKVTQSNADNLFDEEMKDVFSEERFASSRYKCTMVRVPMARGGMVYGLKQIRRKFEIPSEEEIYEFAHQLFNSVQLSSECSIVCLIYVERLMEASKVPLLASTWRPIFMCGLLLASKVWQDLSSWNIEFASVYPQFSLDAINRLEILFLRMIKWDLYISSSCYAKYYFALRSLVEKPDFRQRYNRMVGLDSVQASEALKIERRSTQVKEEAISQLSRSM